MNWFGQSWGAPVCTTNQRVETPVGAACVVCEKPIRDGDRGFSSPMLVNHEPPEFTMVVYHHACFMWELGLGARPDGVPVFPVKETIE